MSTPIPPSAPAPSPDAAAPAASAVQTIPYDRFQRVVAEKRAAMAQNAALQAQLDALSQKGATVDTLSSQLQTMTAARDAADARYSTYAEIAGVTGLTDGAIVAAIESSYQGLPAQDRPDRGEWVRGLRDDPTKAPPLLRPHFSGLAAHHPGHPAAPAVRSDPAPASAPRFPPSGAGTRQHLHASPQFTSAQVAAMSDADFLANVGNLDAALPGLGLSRNPFVLAALPPQGNGRG